LTAEGSPYTRFQRCLAAGLRTGRWPLAWAAATEVEHVELQDALVLVLLVVEEPRFPRAAARWIGRVCLEIPSITLREVQLAGDALCGLPDTAAAGALASVCSELGLGRGASATRTLYGS
jgi:hypothetical protein